MGSRGYELGHYIKTMKQLIKELIYRTIYTIALSTIMGFYLFELCVSNGIRMVSIPYGFRMH
jgi:hypothetical protein